MEPTLLLPMSPLEGPPLPRALGLRWPGTSEESEGEGTVGATMLKLLVTKTINDISYEQMSRIVHRLRDMSREDRNVPPRVAQVLHEELGFEKALKYIEKGLASGAISARDYYQMRGAITLLAPKRKLPEPWAGAGSRELLAKQKELRKGYRGLPPAAREAIKGPFGKVDAEIEKLRKAWGLP